MLVSGAEFSDSTHTYNTQLPSFEYQLDNKVYLQHFTFKAFWYISILKKLVCFLLNVRTCEKKKQQKT